MGIVLIKTRSPCTHQPFQNKQTALLCDAQLSVQGKNCLNMHGKNRPILSRLSPGTGDALVKPCSHL